MLHTKYQRSMPGGFRQQDVFYVFPYTSLSKTLNRKGGAITLWPKGHNKNRLGRCPLDDATNHNSMLYIGLMVSINIFSGLPYISVS